MNEKDRNQNEIFSFPKKTLQSIINGFNRQQTGKNWSMYPDESDPMLSTDDENKLKQAIYQYLIQTFIKKNKVDNKYSLIIQSETEKQVHQWMTDNNKYRTYDNNYTATSINYQRTRMAIVYAKKIFQELLQRKDEIEYEKQRDIKINKLNENKKIALSKIVKLSKKWRDLVKPSKDLLSYMVTAEKKVIEFLNLKADNPLPAEKKDELKKIINDYLSKQKDINEDDFMMHYFILRDKLLEHAKKINVTNASQVALYFKNNINHKLQQAQIIEDQIGALKETVEISDTEIDKLKQKINQLQPKPQQPLSTNINQQPREINNPQQPVANNQRPKGFFRKIANGISGFWKKMFGKRNIQNNTATISLNSINQQRGRGGIS